MKKIGYILSMFGYIAVGMIAKRNGFDTSTFTLLIGCVLLSNIGVLFQLIFRR